MSKFFLFAFALILGFSPSLAQTRQFEGNIPGVQDGAEITHYYLNDKNEKEALETTEVKSEKFVLTLPEVPFQSANYIAVEGVPGEVLFVNENKNIQATIFKDSLYSSYIEGGESNKMLREFTYYMIDAHQRLLQISAEYNEEDLNDPAVRKKAASQQSLIVEESKSYFDNMISTYPNSYGSLLILTDLISDQTLTLSEAKTSFDKLSSKVQSTALGKVMKDLLAEVDKVSVGNPAPDFTSLTPDGDELSLQEVMAEDGNYTLVVFWASWCPYCRQEMPEVARIYKQYRAKGMKVIAVSLDTNRQEWLEAVEGYHTDWHNVSRLAKWDDPTVRLYEVHSIPTNFLLDEKGTIIAHKLKGSALSHKMKELLGE